MAPDYASSITGKTIRLTRLNPDGTLQTGASASYVNPAMISVSMTPEYEDGDEFTQKNAAGETCVTYKAPDTLKRVGLEVAICDPDPAFTEMISGGTLLGNGKGWAAPAIGIDAMPNGVAIEVWSQAIVNGKPTPTDPYYHWVFPYAVMRQGGDRVIENGILATSFQGWSVGNEGFGSGPNAPLWEFPEETDKAYAYARTDSAPSGRGYREVTA